MIRLLVVDDEQEIRDYLAGMEEWSTIHCEVVGKAANGREALEMIDRLDPDVVITDLMMPVMDGIELAKTIRLSHSQMPIIFLTAYSDFEYARTAIKLGVADFITKPFQPKDLVACVKLLKRHKQGLQEWVKQEEMFALFCNPDLSDREKLNWMSENHWYDRKFILLYAEIDNASIVEMQTQSISRMSLKSKIMEVVEQSLFSCLTALSNKGVYIILFTETGYDCPSVDDALELACSIASAKTEQNLYTLSVGISRQADSFIQLSERVQQVLKCMDYRMLLGRKSVLAYDALEEFLEGSELDYDLTRSQIAEFIRQGNLDGIRQCLSSTYRRMLTLGTTKKNMQQFCIDMIETEERVMHEYGIEEVSNRAVDIRKEILSYSILTSMMQCLEREFQRCLLLIADKQQYASNRIIAETRQIIEQEYNQDLSLQSIAERLNVNYSYLSRLIKKETGNNFRNLLWECRIEAAKHKLAYGDMKAYEVAYAVGFKDPTHFSLLFKRIVGLSPSAYRIQATKVK